MTNALNYPMLPTVNHRANCVERRIGWGKKRASGWPPGSKFMALEMKESSKWWYCRLRINGKMRRYPLYEVRGGKKQRLAILGRRPPTIQQAQLGDAAFQESLRKAMAAADRLAEEELAPGKLEEYFQKIVETKTGNRIDFRKVADLPSLWADLPRKRSLSKPYVASSQKILSRFAEFMAAKFPAAEDLAGVRAEMVAQFLATEDLRDVSPRTWNATLKVLKTVFAKLEPLADGYRRYLKEVVPRAENTVHRMPFSTEELELITTLARGDDLLRGPIAVAASTAMRRADCCLLRWGSVDMKAGFILVRTGKTSEFAEIPILPWLREELERMLPRTSDFVFPQAAQVFLKSPWVLDLRLKKILEKAGFVSARVADRVANKSREQSLPVAPPEEQRRLALAAIAAKPMRPEKAARMIRVFDVYAGGKTVPAVAAELGLATGSVSNYLNEIEKLAGVAVLRDSTPLPNLVRAKTQAENARGQRRSLVGWHSFRVAFVTHALAGGMPEELVRRVTGHQTVNVVREHYFRPNRAAFKKAFEAAMPQMLIKPGTGSRDEQLREIITKMPAGPEREAALRLLEESNA